MAGHTVVSVGEPKGWCPVIIAQRKTAMTCWSQQAYGECPQWVHALGRQPSQRKRFPPHDRLAPDWRTGSDWRLCRVFAICSARSARPALHPASP